MKKTELKKALDVAVEAARAAGQLISAHLRSIKKVNLEAAHDIKLDLDIRCQKRIEKLLLTSFPQIAILGEEGVAGDPAAPCRWVIDPIDGTVNFAYGIPHACVSIALQSRLPEPSIEAPLDDGFETLLGVVYDPFRDELWTAIRGQPARLNGKTVRVSQHRELKQAIISVGFSKSKASLEKMLPKFQNLVHRVRKIRIMGSATLDLVYVASGRMDAYIEASVRLWDIAAGGLILQCAGGEFWRQRLEGDYYYQVLANNGLLRPVIERLKLAK